MKELYNTELRRPKGRQKFIITIIAVVIICGKKNLNEKTIIFYFVFPLRCLKNLKTD